MPDVVRVLTWNLQGSQGLDIGAVGRVLVAAAPDVVALQEVQRAQARRLAASSGLAHMRWAFKHWPVATRPEGLAVLSRWPLTASSTFVSRPGWPWSWRRRVALEATAVVEGRPLRIVDVHLSPHDAPDRRREEAERVAARRGVVAPIVAGDVNERPGGPAVGTLRNAGWADAWACAHPAGGDGADPGATNWTAGARAGRPPTQRLDVVLVPEGWRVVACAVVDTPLAELAALSDHLPLHCDLEPV